MILSVAATATCCCWQAKRLNASLPVCRLYQLHWLLSHSKLISLTLILRSLVLLSSSCFTPLWFYRFTLRQMRNHFCTSSRLCLREHRSLRFWIIDFHEIVSGNSRVMWIGDGRRDRAATGWPTCWYWQGLSVGWTFPIDDWVIAEHG